MYPAFAKDQLTTNRPASKLDGIMWSCVSKQGVEQGMEPVLGSKPFAHRSGRSFGQFDLSICVCLSNGTAARLANPEDRN